MNPSSSKPEVGQVVEIAWADRWQVYRRLQELSIPCHCGMNKPLVAQVNDVAAAIQLWSVVRPLNVSRRDLITWLEQCWQMRQDQ
ncbi:MAG TPA: Asr1405/Asl0597 family protein [Coleofasciculaceae cyanobacterium]